MKPGAMAFQRMFMLPSSWATELVKPMMPALPAAWFDCPVLRQIPMMELMLTILPFLAFIIGRMTYMVML
jgi:hypothetical protein